MWWFETEKEYIVDFENPIHDTMILSWKKGIVLTRGAGVARADQVERLGRKKLRVVLHQGMNRQIRRMAARTNNSVIGLKRTREIIKIKKGIRQWRGNPIRIRRKIGCSKPGDI